MFLSRSASLHDLDDLFELSSKVLFINLPNDRLLIEDKIKRSLECFRKPFKDYSKNHYLFVLEDLTTKKVIGVSMIHAQHGDTREPHFFLKVSSEHKYSQTINTGFVHGTLKLGVDTDGPTEIGGLVLNLDYRGNKEKLGKQISFVRFLYMALHKKCFKETILSELMPPLDKDKNSPLWEAIGRRFMNMDYAEADKLSRSNKEFILSLFPSENIYMTLLSYEARNAVGKVGPETLPVKSMLENIGFEYSNEIDPFDGGPHYRCKLTDISLVRSLFQKKLVFNEEAFNSQQSECEEYLITFKSDKYPFITIKTQLLFFDDKVILPLSIIKRFDLHEDISICGIPF